VASRSGSYTSLPQRLWRRENSAAAAVRSTGTRATVRVVCWWRIVVVRFRGVDAAHHPGSARRLPWEDWVDERAGTRIGGAGGHRGVRSGRSRAGRRAPAAAGSASAGSCCSGPRPSRCTSWHPACSRCSPRIVTSSPTYAAGLSTLTPADHQHGAGRQRRLPAGDGEVRPGLPGGVHPQGRPGGLVCPRPRRLAGRPDGGWPVGRQRRWTG
jgi:hypothetical protein